MRLAVLLALLLAAPAQAATVTGSNPLAITDGTGEINTLRVETTDTGLRITDTSADLTNTATSCESAGARTVNCEGTFGALSADLGDGDDQLTVIGTFLNLELAGGYGNDALDIASAQPFARDAQFSLTGNDGDDDLTGSPDDDSLSGGPGSDAIDGRAGFDDADYSDHADDIVVNLTRAGGQGALGEGDVLTSIEGVLGGLGDDVLIGNDDANDLRGNQGHDKIRGHAGDDSLDGDGIPDPESPGGDTVRGGAGKDRIAVGPHSIATGDKDADSITGFQSRLSGGAGDDFLDGTGGRTSCGLGNDTARAGTTPDFIAPDCERVSPFLHDELVLGPLHRRGDSLAVHMTCHSRSATCSGRLRVNHNGALAHGVFSLARGHERTFRFHTNRPPHGVLRVILRQVVVDANTDYAPVRYDTRL